MTETVFYDGACGLCHGWVRLLLTADRDGGLFRYAPLDGPTYRSEVDETRRRDLPDSIVLLTPGGLLTRSDAVIHVLRRLGGWWTVPAALIAVFPRGWRDAAYDLVARVRHKLFQRPGSECPLVPAPLGERFLP